MIKYIVIGIFLITCSSLWRGVQNALIVCPTKGKTIICKFSYEQKDEELFFILLLNLFFFALYYFYIIFSILIGIMINSYSIFSCFWEIYISYHVITKIIFFFIRNIIKRANISYFDIILFYIIIKSFWRTCICFRNTEYSLISGN